MTLQDRRTQLLEQLQTQRDTRARYQDVLMRITSQIEQMTGAVTMLEQLIAEEGSNHASQVGCTAAVHGDEVRPGETVEER